MDIYWTPLNVPYKGLKEFTVGDVVYHIWNQKEGYVIKAIVNSMVFCEKIGELDITIFEVNDINRFINHPVFSVRTKSKIKIKLSLN